MPFTTSAKNGMLDSLSAFYAAAFTADPGQAGANEVAGGDYARVQGTFGAAADGARPLTADVEMSIPADTTVAYVGWFSAASGGSLVAVTDSPDETFNSAGILRILAASTSLSLSDS